ncbi:glycoside hydrolase family 31 protein [Pleurocapsales cyanobacterium LEGE 06147]|nr:glycoside hydrolase family 31 protein [Pleurocapsales cyanobacterium LEGE 06147]
MNIFQQIALNFRIIKLRRFLGSWYYSWQRDRWERQFSSPTAETPVEPGKLLDTERTNRGGRFRFENAELEISFLSTELVRIDWQPGKLPIPYGIARDDWEVVETQLDKKDDGVIVSSSALKIIVSSDGSLEWQDTRGKIIRQELPPQRQGEAWRHRGQLRPEERIYGLGERAAPLNLRTERGKNYRMWNYDAGGFYGPGTDPLYLCIPVYIGLHLQGSYLIFYENTYSGDFTLDELATAYFEGGALRYYLTIGEPTKLLKSYTQLTGHPPLPPRWVFGYHQSRWGYETEEEVRKTVEGFKIYDLPLSAIHLDIDCKDNFRSFTIDPDRFPKIRDFNRELAAKEVRLIAIVNPGVKAERNGKLYREGIAQEVFCTLPNGKVVYAPVWPGMCAFPDFTNPLARHWWSRQYDYLLDLGITGFWHDMNEPGVFPLWGDATLPRPTRHFLEGRGGDHVEAHNVYGLLQARSGYEALREYQPQRRPFIVSRSGWAGLQRYAWTWTGDVETSWQGLRQTIPTVLGMSLSGIPYTGPDIGGFKGNPSPELYLRWFQMATFLPFCRTHSANNVKPRTPWSYEQQTLNIVREFLQLRYKLIPYLYTLAWEASQKGYPPVRPLFWTYEQDQKLWDIDDAFFLGDAFLVCPILEEGARQREVIVPQGHWYGFWNDTVIEGGKKLTFDAPLKQIPLLVKAGSIIPTEEGDLLILHLYAPVKEGTSIGYLYSDAGDGYGDWRIDNFELTRSPEGLELIWEQQENYTFPYKQVQICCHGIELQQAWLDEQEVKVERRKINCQPFRQARLLIV